MFRTMAAGYADHYVGEMLLPPLVHATKTTGSTMADVREALSTPLGSLFAFYSHYAFARRGKDRLDLADIACEALRLVTHEDGGRDLLTDLDGMRIWDAFAAECERRKRKPMEQLNRGVIAGMAELAQEIYRLDGVGSIPAWIVRGIMQNDRIEPQFLRIVDIRGVGPKTTSSLLRDFVFLYGLEEQIDHADRLYFQPIDRWARQAAPYLIPEVHDEGAADWVLAGKLAKYARRSGVSGIRFNMGLTYFGVREVREPCRFDTLVNELFSPNSDLSEIRMPAEGRSSTSWFQLS